MRQARHRIGLSVTGLLGSALAGPFSLGDAAGAERVYLAPQEASSLAQGMVQP